MKVSSSFPFIVVCALVFWLYFFLFLSFSNEQFGLKINSAFLLSIVIPTVSLLALAWQINVQSEALRQARKSLDASFAERLLETKRMVAWHELVRFEAHFLEAENFSSFVAVQALPDKQWVADFKSYRVSMLTDHQKTVVNKLEFALNDFEEQLACNLDAFKSPNLSD